MLVWLSILGIWIMDRILKLLIQGSFSPNETLILWPKVLHLTYVLNPGAAFGLMAGQTRILIIAAVVVVAGIIYAQFKIPTQKKLTRLSLGMIGGGALGNLYDRVVGGKVVDYLDFQIWPFVFNFSDITIGVGVILLLSLIYFDNRKVGRADRLNIILTKPEQLQRESSKAR